MLRKLKIVLGWTLVALFGVFVLFNLESVEVWFFGSRIQTPIAFVVLLSAVAGAAIAALLRAWLRRRSSGAR